MKRNNDLKILNYISIGIMIITFFLALLLPMPYEGRESTVFYLIKNDERISDARAIILFELLMVLSFGWSFSIYKYTSVPTIQDIQFKLNKMEINYKLSSEFSRTFINSLEEIKTKNYKDLEKNDIVNAKKLEIEFKKNKDQYKKDLEEKNKQIKKLEKEAGIYKEIKREILESDDDEE